MIDHLACLSSRNILYCLLEELPILCRILGPFLNAILILNGILDDLFKELLVLSDTGFRDNFARLLRNVSADYMVHRRNKVILENR
jgi:hypothetical protein